MNRVSILLGLVIGFGAIEWSSAVASVEIDPGQSEVFKTPSGAFAPKVSCGGALNECKADAEPSEGKMWLYSTIVTGVDQDIEVEQTLYSEFSVSPDDGSGRVLDANIFVSVDFDANLQSTGIGGDRSEFTIIASLYDETADLNVISKEIFNDVCPSNFPDAVCLHNVDGPRTTNFSAKVKRGHTYSLRLTARCESHNSLSVDIQCSAANPRPFPGTPLPAPEGFVQWQEFSVTVEPDLVGQLNELTLLVEQLQSSLEAHDGNLSQHDQDMKALLATLEGKVNDNNAAILEAIRLLLTPQGRRSSELCDGGDCSFPVKP